MAEIGLCFNRAEPVWRPARKDPPGREGVTADYAEPARSGSRSAESGIRGRRAPQAAAFGEKGTRNMSGKGEMRSVPHDQGQASLEQLVESEDLGLEVLHPGGLNLTRELARLCHIRAGTTVLDVASGSGETACYLARELGVQVVGVDCSDAMIERAREKAAQRSLQIEFQKADAHQLPFKEGAFDAAISECTLCLLEKERAIGEMVRVIKPGGCVGIHDMCWSGDVPEKIRLRLARVEGERPETLEGWKTLFEKAGLIDVEALDRSALIPDWLRGIKTRLGLAGQMRIFIKIVRRWGIRGLRNALQAERIFRSRYTGYGIIVGRKAGGA